MVLVTIFTLLIYFLILLLLNKANKLSEAEEEKNKPLSKIVSVFSIIIICFLIIMPIILSFFNVTLSIVGIGAIFSVFAGYGLLQADKEDDENTDKYETPIWLVLITAIGLVTMFLGISVYIEPQITKGIIEKLVPLLVLLLFQASGTIMITIGINKKRKN